ncbi:MAG: hypothetical protein HKN17_10285 [Rhodothermales bacterium]|nr:hypothetical protein [Rhodothermales bacterium]
MTTAGLELSGHTLRYTEVEQTGSAVRLLRLGNCDFDFDAEADLFSGTEPRRLETLAEAIEDVFENTTATVFRFAVPPAHLTSFTALVPAESDTTLRGDLIAAEAVVLGVPLGGDLFPSQGTSVRRSGLRMHVSHASKTLRDRVTSLCENIPGGEEASGSAVADRHVALLPSSTAVRHLHVNLDGDGDGPALLLGCYPGATEYTVLRGAEPALEWADDLDHPVDRLYFCLDVLDRVSVTVPSVSSVRLYGPDADDDVLAQVRSVFGARARRLNPCPAVNVSPDQFDPEFRFESFGACIGAALS